MSSIENCGSCCFFVAEDLNGFGGCVLKDYEPMVCSDQCDLDHTAIRTDCLLKGLHKWRIGVGISEYVKSKLIDASMYKLRQI